MERMESAALSFRDERERNFLRNSSRNAEDRKESTHHVLMKPQTTRSSKCTTTDIRSRKFDLTSVATTAS